ncbi:MAG: SUMF1/EgtB/PvdO family nonheme iron enzyme, partial [Caldilineaceae bacterium]|nr:SUMF1/EgtB/PvdO family nonheme iron enzyme [Caldilineaceae bacterium]
EPGAGKSTLMDWLTLVFCGEIQQPALQALGELLPIYLPLRVCAGNSKPIQELMADPKLLPLSANAPTGFFVHQLEKGGCLVLLDGLDEVVDRTAHRDAAEKINQLVRTYPKNHYVVTCRTAGWEEGLLTGDFTRLLIRSFSDADVQRFVAGWYRAVRSQQVAARVGLSEEGRKRALDEAHLRARREAQSLLDALDTNDSLSDLARNPLILSLIALVHYRRYKLPEGRAKLYQECLEILLDVWDREDKELDDSGLSLNAKETVLRRIAHYFHTEGVTEADTETLENLIAPLLPEVGCALDAALVLAQIEDRSGILVTRALDRYVFAHRTLQEYLTATVLAGSPERFSSLLAHLGDEPWREVLLLYAGMVDNAAELIQAILRAADKKTGEEAISLLVLAGQCLVEDLHLDEAMRTEVVSRLEAAFDAADEALALEQLGRTLAAIGGQDVASVFGRLLTHPVAAKQIGAARALGRIGARLKAKDAVAELLIQRLATDDAPVCKAACLALADLGWRDARAIAALEAVRERGDEARDAAFWALLVLGQAARYGMVHIPAGEFDMGADQNDPYAGEDEKPLHRLYLDDYYIARHPVTNAEYAHFVQQTGYKVRGSWAEFTGSGRDDHPAVGVTWNDARVYAEWLGAHLPNEAQWEKAAGWDANAGHKRRWPWGDEFDPRLCNVDGGRGSSRGLGGWLTRLRPRQRGKPGTTPVGRYSPGGDS